MSYDFGGRQLLQSTIIYKLVLLSCTQSVNDYSELLSVV